MLTLWGRKTSSNVQAVMWGLAEIGLAYRRIDAGHIYGVVDTPEYLALNPNGKVPTLTDGDNPPLWETGAILRYLANAYAKPPFWPADQAPRAQVDMWAEWSKINVALAFTAPVFWRVVRTAPPKRDPAAIDRALQALEPALRIAEGQLTAHDYLTGPRLTLADIQFGHVLYRYFDIDITRPDLPHLRRYYDRLTARAPYRENVMTSYEELRVTD